METLEKEGQHRAAESLREKADIAKVCCDLAPAFFLQHKLEVLRSLCRSAVRSGEELTIEVLLRLWYLQCTKFIELREFPKLQVHVKIFKDVATDDSIDLLAAPYLSTHT